MSLSLSLLYPSLYLFTITETVQHVDLLFLITRLWEKIKSLH